ncbi:MAG: IgGFc-binding protein [Deltaproteobacteria bacterium]|nr:IgGFc-binding protein [Deltaproteobacteria bacterium]
MQDAWIRGATLLAMGLGAAACGTEQRPSEPMSPTSLTGLTDGNGTMGSGPADTGSSDTMEKLDVAVGETENGSDGTNPGTCAEAAMAESNQGCEFWAVDLPNAWAGSNGSPAPADQQFAVVVANTSSDLPAMVEVFIGGDAAPVAMAEVPIGEIHEFRLDPLNQEPRANTYDGQAYRVESSVPITAYQFNPLDNTVNVFSNDASLLFPTHVLDTDYTAVTGDSILLGTDQDPNGDNSGAFISIVAIEDGTTVDLFPSWGLYAGAEQGVMLDRGQVFTAVSLGPNTFPGSTGDGNLSGSRIVADMPVAVFSGNVATIEPNPGECCADHMEQQMLPLVAWGSGYASAPPPSPMGGATDNAAGYRITGSFDGTALSYSPSAPAGAPNMINAGQTIRFQTDQPFTVTSNDPDQPFAITQFLLSNQILAPFGQAGDPAMISLPAVAQFQTSYIFLVPDGYVSNFVTVLRVAGTDVARDGVSVAAANWRSVGTLDGIDYEYAALSVPTGSHLIESEEPCGIVSVGYDADVSYGYPGGSGLMVISTPPPPPAG